MYQNRITLIGFLGNDAITRTANNASFTVLSLATKSSYKDKKTGEYNSHTEWHRCIVWGRLLSISCRTVARLLAGLRRIRLIWNARD